MAQERNSMRKIKEVLRLHYESKLSQRIIGKACRIGKTSVHEVLQRFWATELSWPLPAEMSDEQLEARLFGEGVPATLSKPLPDYKALRIELAKPNVTMEVLWNEYKVDHPDGYQYSHFCELFRRYLKIQGSSMHQEHKGGEKGFLDFGEGLKLMDRATGELIPTQLFVFVWGASCYTYLEAVLSQDLHDWIGVNVRALEHFGCCPKVEVPDNLKSAVTKACRYEPEINPTYADFASHYGTAIIPARPYRPKDKPHAENGVKLAKRWILARLRNRTFFSLAEMNQAILELLDSFNSRMMRKRANKTRKELFETLDKPNALALPDQRYEYAEWKKCKLAFNYHVECDDHNYSVPYQLIGQHLEIRATQYIVEVYRKGNRVASHRRGARINGYTTVPEHMPPSHQKYLEWTPQRIMDWAEKYGASVKRMVEQMMNQRRHPEQAFKSCLGLIRLERHFTAPRLEAACARALMFRSYSYKGVRTILEKGLDQSKPLAITTCKPIEHANVRGSSYWQAPLDFAEDFMSHN